MQELNTFAAHLKRSQLIPLEPLKALLGEFRAATHEAGKKMSDQTIDDLCQFLIQRQAITAWQATKLKEKKSRGFQLGKYTLLDRLGAGGMSIVYLAENRLLSQKRALKVLPKSRVENSSYLARFYKEAQAAAKLDHPNIVKTYDIDHQDDQHFMVMEYVKGHDLSRWVKENGPLELNVALNYLKQAAIALSHAHQNGLIHRDVKPGNFLIAPKQQLKLLDLGLAKSDSDSASLTMMHNETIMGTADYLSPEQALDSHQVDHRTDIYSLGGTLYFMLAGHPPFPEGTIAQRLAKHQSVNPTPLSQLRDDCPQAVSDLCQWLMEKNVERRCQNCSEVVNWVGQWESSLPVEPTAPTVAPATPTLEDSDKAPPSTARPSTAEPVEAGADTVQIQVSTDRPATPVKRAVRPRPSSGPQPMFLLGGLLVVLFLAAMFLIWVFFFRSPALASVVN